MKKAILTVDRHGEITKHQFISPDGDNWIEVNSLDFSEAELKRFWDTEVRPPREPGKVWKGKIVMTTKFLKQSGDFKEIKRFVVDL
jgi:hypothetical protein